MKKRRIAASVMAAIMAFSTFSSNVIADDLSAVDSAASNEEAILSGSAVSAGTADIADETEEAYVETYAVSGFQSGSIGGVGKNYAVTETDDGANLKITANNKGKISAGSDEYAYYAHEVDLSKDFTMSATINVNSYNVGSTTNPHQSGFGLLGVDDFTTTSDQIMLLSYNPKSADSAGRMAVTTRHNGETSRTVIQDDIAEVPYNNTTSTYDVSITKSGKTYAVKCGDTQVIVDDDTLLTGEKGYFGFFVARNFTEITVTNLKFNVEENAVTSLELVSAPQKTSYNIGEKIDLTGCVVKATYSNGKTEEINGSDLIVSDFDTTTGGAKTMKLIKGAQSIEIPYSVQVDMCVSAEIASQPYINEYSVDMYFNPEGSAVKANISTGETMDLIYEEDYDEAKASDEEKKTPRYAFYLGDKKIDSSYIFKAEDAGDKTIEARVISSESIEANNVVASFDVKISDAVLSGLEVISMPIVTEYYTGQTFDVSGLTVRGIYTNAAGDRETAVLSENDYIVSVPDLTTVGTKVINVTSSLKPEVSTSFNIEVYSNDFIDYRLKDYPVMTVQVGDEFDPTDMIVASYFTSGDLITVDPSKYTIDLSGFDSSKPGVTKVVIKVNAENGAQDIPLDITVREKEEYEWIPTNLGQSTSAGKNYTTMNPDGSVTVAAVNGAGKITADHDGITYYYTRLDADDNFTIKANITVNAYCPGNDDVSRNGQEAFGIMLRDAIPYYDKDGGDTAVPSLDLAKINEATGKPMNFTKANVFASNMAILGGYSGTGYPTDPNAASYVKNTTINRINLVGRVGTIDYLLGGGGEKRGPYKLNNQFPKPGDSFNITLKKVGNGLYAKCEDLQTGEVTDTYQYFDEGFIDSLDPENMYLGFFAAREATFTVNDYELHVTDPATDVQQYTISDTARVPSISVESVYFTNNAAYDLYLKAGNKLGGTVTLKQNGKIVYRGEAVGNRNTLFPVDLVPNSVNNFTAIYTPNQSDNITSTADSVINFEITHKDNAVAGTTLYAGPDGTPAAAGTREDPLDIHSAFGFVQAGQTVICLDGTYKVRTNIDVPVTQYGYTDSPITVKADDGARVIIDLQKLYAGISVRANYWNIKGLEVINSADNQKPFQLAGNYCIIENCKFHDNGDTGFQISRLGVDTNQISEWPTNNLVLNCESYNNADPAGINADGYGAKLTVGYGNVFKGCISHHNIDDGWDTYTKLGSGAIGAVTLEGCVSYRQGYELLENGTDRARSAGGHNGFKMGGENVPVQHYLKDCIAFENGANGVTSNSNPQIKIRNMISYRNSGAGFSLYSANSKKSYNYDLAGCINYGSGSDKIGTVTDDKNYTNGASTPVLSESNYFLIGSNNANVNGEVVTADFFKSLTETDSLTGWRYPQDDEGNFILGDFLARVTPYVHKEEDLIEISTIDYSAKPTQATEATTAEATTKSSKPSGGSSGGGGGGGGSSKGGSSSSLSTTANTETTEKTTKTTTRTDNTTEITTSASYGFSDIADKPWAVDAINALSEAGIIRGVGDNKFAPDASCKRADFVIMLVNVFGIDGTATDNFDDVQAGKYYYNYIGLAKEAGIVNGYGNGKFGPENLCTRAELMVMVANALKTLGNDITADESVLDRFSDADEIPAWAKPFVAYLVSTGIVNGSNGKINANNEITRAEVAVIMFNVVDLSVSDTDVEEPTEESTEEVTEEAEEETEVSEENSTEASTEEAVEVTTETAE